MRKFLLFLFTFFLFPNEYLENFHGSLTTLHVHGELIFSMFYDISLEIYKYVYIFLSMILLPHNCIYL